MRMRAWSFMTALAAVLICGAVALSYAQQAADNGGGAAWRGAHHARMGYLARELNLTDAQKAQIKTMRQSQRATLRPLMQQMAQNRLAMLNATANGAFDQAKVQAIANQQAQIMAQLAVQKASLRSQIYNQVLTADQRAKADQLRQHQVDRINQHLQKMSQASPDAQAQ